MRENIKRKQLNANQLKLIAVAAMLFDHSMALFLSHDTAIGMMLRIPGRIVAPVMCFFIAEGYHYTSDRMKYMWRLLLFALISHVPYVLCFGFHFFQATSVIWGLALGLIALTVIKKKTIHPFFKLLVLMLCCGLSITANWNYVAVLWIVGFGLYHNRFRQQIIVFSIIGICFHVIPTFMNFGFTHEGYPHWYQFTIFFAIPLLNMYSGKRGRKTKAASWFFYIFYPAHLLLLFCIKQVLLYAF